MTFILDNCEQYDVTDEQAALLLAAGLVYHPEEGNEHYLTVPWNVSFDNLDRYLAETTL